MECSIDACDRPAVKRGWCATHYRRWHQHGDPTIVLKRQTVGVPAEERWKLYVSVEPPGCWVWTGSVTPTGYGTYFPAAGVGRGAHRYVYRLLVRELGPDEHLDHLCLNRSCVNPDHLEPVTPAENNRRSKSPTANNARKTHCPQGHPYDGENLRVTSAGARTCKECQRAHLRRSNARRKESGKVVLKGNANARKTHCPQGHSYDDDNTYVTPAGVRQCRTCRAAHAQRK